MSSAKWWPFSPRGDEFICNSQEEEAPFEGTWDDFFDMFKEKRLYYGDCIEHALGWWKNRDNSNVLLLRYDSLQWLHIIKYHGVSH